MLTNIISSNTKNPHFIVVVSLPVRPQCKQIARALRLHSSIDSWFKVIFDWLSINSARVGSLHCYVTKQSKCIMCFRPSQVRFSKLWLNKKNKQFTLYIVKLLWCVNSKRRQKTIRNRYVLSNILILIIFAFKRGKLFCTEFVFTFH